MRKKCVRWTAFVRIPLVAVAIILALPMSSAAQSNDPSTLPLLSAEGIQYKGAFRLPAQSANGDSFAIGGRPMTFNPAQNSLFIGSRAGRIAEVAIPASLGNSADPNALPFASYLQPFSDPTEGRLSQITNDGVAIDGLLILNNRLYGTASIYYDAMNAQRVSHYSHSLQLNQSSFSGWSSVWDPVKTGFVSGAMAAVPAEWQSRLGGPAITGQCCIPIVTRTSWGPAAFAFDPAQIGKIATVPAQPLLYYTGDHHTLGNWESSNATYGMGTAVGGVAIISGTRTVLYFGRNGIGPACYGQGTGNQSLAGQSDGEGGQYCYDPANSSKGTHAYPYRYQIWAYDLNDFVAVREGRKQPWDVTPYGVWPLNFPTPEVSTSLGGVGYDAARQIIYVSQMLADRDGYEYRPIIHAFDLRAALSAGAATGVAIDADKTAPQAPNAAITFTATSSGGQAPHQYRWAIHDGTTWTNASAWSASNRFTWTPTSANANYRVAVGVRGASNTSDTPETSSWVAFAIAGSGSATSGSVISAITLAVNRTAPQLTATPITFTATATGGVVPYQYKFLVYDGLGWNAVTGWSELNTFTWTPAIANPDYRVGVWARSAGNSRDEPEASASSPFAIAAPAPVLVSAVTIAANKTAPQKAGTAITWTATASGGVAPVQYKWLVYDDSWKVVTGWSTSNTFTWTPSVANADYQVGVWVRGGNNTNDTLEVSTSTPFPITAAAATPRANAVVLGVNRIAPQTVGTTMIATATVSGGVGPYTYKWLVYDANGWQAVTGWTSSNTYSWTPTKADANYQIGVWVRSAGNTNEEIEASGTLPFVIK
jgi:hypothetical protein